MEARAQSRARGGGMRIGIVSDVHGNIAGLQAALDRMDPIDELLCAGDSVYQYRWSNEAVALLRERGARVVLGNHDEIILGRDGERARAMEHVRGDLVEWLREQPYAVDAEVGGRRFLMAHSSPWGGWEYHYPHDPLWKRTATLEHDVVVTGHTHVPMAERFGDTLVINPGSVGEARHPGNGYRLSCALWDTASDEVHFYEYEDPSRPSRVLASGGAS